MTPKQMNFCLEYLIDCNATQAAIRAGYSEKCANSHATRLLQKKEIQDYISQELEKVKQEKIAQTDEIMAYLTSVMRGEEKEQVLRLCGDGVQTVSDIDIATKDRIKAAELLGKRYGMFKDNIAVEGAIPIIIEGGDALAD